MERTNITYLAIIMAILIMSFGFNCNHNDKTEATNKTPSGQNKSVKSNIPVSKDNPVAASSTLEGKTFGGRQVNYSARNVLDFKDNTAWIENSKKGGVGEWLAIYLGEGGSIKDISEVEVYILTFYQNHDENGIGEGGNDYLKPTIFNIELYVDTTLITSTKDAEKDKNDNRYIGDIPRFLKSNTNNLQSGTVWVKMTIMKSEITWEGYDGSKRNNNALIGDVMLNIKNENPHNIKETISKFAKGINGKNKSIIAEFTDRPYKEILEEFTNEFVPEEGAKCNPTTLRIQSENIAFVFATEGGDGGSWAKFEYKNGKWNFIETIYFSSN